ncbi:MAG: hypothetical protein ACT4P1_01840 [Sporichthyaceae bacterium]
MHWMRAFAGLQIVAVAAIGVGAWPASALEEPGKLTVCVYGLGADESATVTVNDQPFGAYPAEGKCETDKVESGAYVVQVDDDGSAALDQAEIIDRDGRRTDDTAERIDVEVHPDSTTRVNIFMR